jgi:hypothetical protein
VSTRIGSCSGTIPVSIPIACLIDRFDEGVELLIARGVGIQPRLSKDLGSRPQPTPFGTHARQVAGASLLGVSVPAGVQGRPLGVVLTPGQRHDSTQLEPVLDAIAVPWW